MSELADRKTFDEFTDELPGFSQELRYFEEHLNDAGINSTVFRIDHVCLRLSDWEHVQAIEEELLTQGSTLLSKVIVNERPISVIKLVKPLKVLDQMVDVLELPYPRGGQDTQNRWDHVEFVVPSEAMTLVQFKRRFETRFPSVNYLELGKQEIRERTLQPKVEGEQLPNPTISYVKTNGLAIKFHPRSLEEVVTSRKKEQ